MTESIRQDHSMASMGLATTILTNSSRRIKHPNHHISHHATTTTTTTKKRSSTKKHKKVASSIRKSNHRSNTPTTLAQDYAVDKAIEKIIESHFPTDEVDKTPSAEPERKEISGFSLSTMASNIRKLNSKTKFIFRFQSHVFHVFSWRQPTATISILLIYTLFCLNPRLLPGLPILLIIVFVMAPGYDARHPLPDTLLPTEHFIRSKSGYTNAEAETAYYEEQEMAKQELINSKRDQRELGEKLKDLQDALVWIVDVVEAVEKFFGELGSFANEKRATALYFVFLAALILTVCISFLVDLRYVLLVGGWAGTILVHPEVYKMATKPTKTTAKKTPSAQAGTATGMDLIGYIEDNEVVIEDKDYECKTVEVFELQRQGLTPADWTPWVFSREVYDASSVLRKSQRRPPGTPFLQDIKAPKGWKFKKSQPWEIDVDSESWILTHGVHNVQESADGWVYDYHSLGDLQRKQQLRQRKMRIFSEIDGDEYLLPSMSTENGYDSDEASVFYDGDEYRIDMELKPGRGEWRRRRWIRRCYLV